MRAGLFPSRYAALGLALAALAACAPSRPAAPETPTTPPLAALQPETRSQNPKTDLYGEPLPPGAIVRMGSNRFKHTDSVNTLAFSPDGRMLASGIGHRAPSNRDNAIYLWDASTGKELIRINISSGPVMAVAFSPDGGILASACEDIEGRDNSIGLWSTSTGKEILRIKGHESLVHDVAFSPDGKTLASRSGDEMVRLWDVASGKDRLRIEVPWKVFTPSIAFSPDGKTLAAGNSLWDAGTGKERIRLEDHDVAVSHITFSPDGKTLASAHENAVCLWNAETGARLRTMNVRREGPPLFDMGDSVEVRSVVFSPDKRLFAVCWHSMLRVYEVVSGKEVFTLCLPDGVWSQNRFKSAAFSPNDRMLAVGCESGLIRMWESDTWSELNKRQGHIGVVRSIAYSHDGKKLASAGGDDTIRLWDAVTGNELVEIEEKYAHTVCFSPEDNRLASVSGGVIRLRDTVTSREITKFQTTTAMSIAFSPDGKTFASGHYDDSIHVWQAATGEELLNIEHAHLMMVSSIVFSLDGKTVASAGMSHRPIRFWDTVTGKEILSIGDPGCVTTLSYSPDGKTLVSGGDQGDIRLWETATGKGLLKFEGNQSQVWSLSVSPDGKMLASGHRDQTISLWEMATGNQILKIEGHGEGSNTVAFSPDGTKLASGLMKSAILIWDVAALLKDRK